MYQIQVTKRADKALRRLPAPVRKKIDAALLRLQQGDFHGTARVEGLKQKVYRVAIGGGGGSGYRVFYYLSERQPGVLIIPHISSREDAYDSALRTMDLDATQTEKSGAEQ